MNNVLNTILLNGIGKLTDIIVITNNARAPAAHCPLSLVSVVASSKHAAGASNKIQDDIG